MLFAKGLAWNIDSCSQINLWEDRWILGKYTLKELVHGPLDKEDSNKSLSHIIPNKKWNLRALQYHLPPKINTYIKQTYIPFSYNARDTFFWKETEDGNFTTKSAYMISLKLSETNPLLRSFDHN